MRWRLRPRAAVIVFLSVSALIATTAGLRRTDTRESEQVADSIDRTLTRDADGCAGISSTVWHPLSGVEYTGRLRFTLPAQFGGAIAFYVGDVLPLDIEALTARDEPAKVDHQRLVLGPGVLVPPDYWLEDGSPLDTPRHVTRVVIDAEGDRARSIVLAMGRRAPRVLVRLIGYPAHVRVPVCAHALAAGEMYFATGWYGQEAHATQGSVRWMRDAGAVLMMSRDGRAVRVRAQIAAAADGDPSVELIVRVNDFLELPPVRLRTSFSEYEFVVPDEAWVQGVNELLFRVSRSANVTGRMRGMALASLHVD
jgi:hypothetical protein